jgi:uncharacterized protein YndB with AHSA1/START domain
MTTAEPSLARTVLIHAPRAVVFRYFTDPQRFARWWGEGSTIDARPGGAVTIVYPNRVVARGTVVALQSDTSITFTYGYDDPQKPIPPGGSTVTIDLQDHAEGTLLQLRHRLPTTDARDQHVPGWRFQLARFANVVAAEQHAGLEAIADAWFAAWTTTDAEARAELLRRCTTDDVRLADAWACVAGRGELQDHIALCQQHAPGTVMRRAGAVRHVQGTALVDWTASDAAGQPRGAGTNVLTLAADGRLAGVVGFW